MQELPCKPYTCDAAVVPKRGRHNPAPGTLGRCKGFRARG